ncbi:MAG TPA: VOC family protein, partial [Candidatus Binatia bacterium]
HRWWNPLSKGERLVDFCFQTDDLRGDTDKLRAAGVAIDDPVPWSRKRPDGYELKWMLSLATGSHRGVAPFLIEDVTPRIERVPQQFHHQNGVSGIAKVTVAASELKSIEKWYHALLGVSGQNVVDNELGAEGLVFHVGPHVLEFLSPHDAASPLIGWLRQCGPSPYSTVLKGDGIQGKPLDIRLTHGAHFIV